MCFLLPLLLDFFPKICYNTPDTTPKGAKMTQTTKEVFEKYQIRKTKKQKQAFRSYVKAVAEETGCKYTEEKGSMGAQNIIIGDPESAKVIYTAHYDTCARLPFPNFITPKSMGLYLLYNVVIVACIVAIMLAVILPTAFVEGIVLASLNVSFPIMALIMLALYLVKISPGFLFIYLMMFGPANKHTANDNTSGVTLLLDLMTTMTEEEKEKAALIFFDHEEIGLLGSSGFASKHKKIAKETLLLNFDCISDGNNILFALKKGSADKKELIEECFRGNDKLTVEATTKCFYPSDQANFKKGVGVAALLKSKKGILYMNKIHTKKDTVYQEENIAFLCEGAKNLLKKF